MTITMHQSVGKDLRRMNAITCHSKYLYKRWRSGRRRMLFHFPAGTLSYSRHSDTGYQFCQCFVFTLCIMIVFIWVLLHVFMYFKLRGNSSFSNVLAREKLLLTVKQDVMRVNHDIQKLISQVKKESPAEAHRRLMHRVYANRVADLISKASEESRRLWSVPNFRDWADEATYNNNNDGEETRKTVLYNLTTKTLHDPSAQRCPDEPPGLQGRRENYSYSKPANDVLDQIHQAHPDVKLGGEWEPKDCAARYRLAVVIPYRDRRSNLIELLASLLPVLKRQQLHFRIFVVEQHGEGVFNKGRIMNSAFWEASRLYKFDCVVFHDVDLVSLDDRNMYSCPDMPRHMSVAIDAMQFRLPYDLLVGGVLNFRADHFLLVNGYSNLYWGWGAEDDDMASRIIHVGLRIQRPPACIARFHKLAHVKRKPATFKSRAHLLKKTTTVYHVDGLSNVPYKLIHTRLEALYTHIMVEIGRPYNPT